MKKIFFPIFSLGILLSFCGCKKNNDNPSSYWTFNGVSHIPKTVAFNGSALLAQDSLGTIELFFGEKPTETTVYPVQNAYPSPAICNVNVLAKFVGYHCLNVGTVAVTVSAGKVTARLSDIRVMHSPGDTIAIAGTLIEQ